MLCEGKIADLALVTVDDDQFWTDDLLDLQFVDVPELQASKALAASQCLVLPACLHRVCACSRCMVVGSVSSITQCI